ncbi:GFA family protein [Marimonas arenosa]|uniref:GFA family protein n=1 Tax=Marimonas arenosa TaxID=1795305 RepID=A0AAE4B723_9RHOB|nr:GFA family protein [Marimonas arenosa]MDQ2091939.1 GFA family protein [Marimonas arenosa]
MNQIIAPCTCGKSHIELRHLPSFRFFCHCTICQRVYGKPYSDVAATHMRNVTLPAQHATRFGKYKRFMALDRGLCGECGEPVVGFMRYLPGVPLAMVPVANLGEQGASIMPRMHIYYGTRQRDIDDDLPKYEGALRSITACIAPFLASCAKSEDPPKNVAA